MPPRYDRTSVIRPNLEPPAPRDTIVNLPSWTRFNDPNRDRARLVPYNSAARIAFQEQYRLYNAEESEIQGQCDDEIDREYARPFYHFEETEAELADPEVLPETGSQMSATDDSSDRQETCTPKSQMIVGYFRIDPKNVAPRDPKRGWILGLGRPKKQVEFILSSNPKSRVHGRHCRLVIHESGRIAVASDGNYVYVNGSELRRKGIQPSPGSYQRALKTGDIITIGNLEYRFEDMMVPKDLEFEDSAWDSLFVPTPGNRTIEVHDYVMSAAFAAGTFGTVSIAEHLATGARYAVKRLVCKSKDDVRRVISEVALLNDCSHENIVRLHEHFRLNTVENPGNNQHIEEHFLIMKPILRFNLRYVLQGHKKVQDRAIFARSVGVKMAAAVRYLSTRNIMHRDIKPENIGLNWPDEEVTPRDVVLLDLGSAVQSRTSDNHYKGTVDYLAPEVDRLKAKKTLEPYNAKVDVYSLGLVLGEIVLGVTLKDKHHAQTIREEVRAVQGLEDRLQRTVLGMLEVDSERRWTIHKVFQTLST